MITYLRLENFRRHAQTELRFDAGHQVVLIAGSNGVGKSTLFEAVLFALYGEGRNGRGNLERLVRKGGELEGMEVEVAYTIGETTYRVRRRRDSKVTSAVLYGNDEALTEGSREVTAEVSKILGMDARGFKLATYAQQKELDGLASMRPGDRGKMLARLLRLDVLTRAKEQARSEFNEHKALLSRLNSTVDIEAAEKARVTALAGIAGLEHAVNEATAALLAIDADLAATDGIELRYVDAARHAAASEERLAHAHSEAERLETELRDLVIPDPLPDPGMTHDEVAQRAGEVERLLLKAEAVERDRAQIANFTRELHRCEEELDEIAAVLAGDEPDVAGAMSAVAACELLLNDAQERLAHAREDHARLSDRLERAKAALETAETLDARCDTCGQNIAEDHRHTQLQRSQSAVADLEQELAACVEAGRVARDAAVNGRVEFEKLQTFHAQAVRDAQERDRATKQRVELQRRCDVYLSSLERLSDDMYDTEALYAERTQLAATMALLRQAHEQQTVRAVMIERQKGVRAQLAGALSNVAAATAAMGAATIDADLELSYKARQALGEQRQVEAALLSDLSSELGVARERLRGIEREIERGAFEQRRRSEVDTNAQIALYSSQTLERLEAEWAQQIRPSLEGSVSELLGRLSDGRFDGIKLDADYNVTVRDDTTFRPLADLSGGEIDLVALAMRLGLASVVAERHGAGGAGFLILDECFGSQDADRRGSILTALRSLRGMYGQIFLVSHVGGLDEAADAVVEVVMDDNKIAQAEM
jgi:exonuclease SbcC